MIRVFLADDHQIVREGVARLLGETTDIEVAGEAGTAAELGQRLADASTRVDVLVLDLSLPDGSGVEVIKQVRQHRPRLPILVLSMHAEDLYAVRVLSAGASGFLTKGRPSRMLLDAIRRLAAGGRYITPEIADLLLQGQAAPDKPLHGSLSERQFAILVLVGEGHSPSEIAARLGVRASTVSSHLAQIKQRLALRTIGELAQYALRAGLSAERPTH